MDYTALPPEINSGRMYSGPGSSSMLAAAQAWDELSNELYTTAHNYGSVVSSLTAGPWQGPSSAAMSTAAAPHSAWLTATAAQAEQAGAQARAAAGAHSTAYAMTVPPPMIAANRSALATLVATNVLGQNAPAIAATEAQYGQMWAQDAAAMHGYAAASQAAAQMTPFTSPQQTSNSSALGTQGASQAAGTSAGSGSVGQALSGLSQALSSGSGGAGGLSAAGSMSEIFALGEDFVLDAGIIGTIFGADTYSGAGLPGALVADTVPVMLTEAPAAAGLASAAPLEGAAAAAGKATAISGMSVPQGWATAAPGMRLATAEAPNIGLTAPKGAGGTFGNMPLFGGAPLMTLPGRGDSRDQRDSDEAQRRAKGGRAAL